MVCQYGPDLSGNNQVDAATDLFQIGGVTTRKFNRHVSLVTDLTNRLANLRPVDAALTKSDELSVIGLEVLEMHLDDPLAKGANPLLRIAVHHDISDIEIGLDPRALELVDITDMVAS